MRPLDPRLLKYAHSARLAIAFTAISGIIQAILVIAQCFLISALITPVISLRVGWQESIPMLYWLLLVICLRALLIWARTAHQHRSAKKVIQQLREKLLAHALKLGPRWSGEKASDVVTLSSRGLEDLAPYFIDYIPQLILSATVTPLTLLVMGYLDWLSALVAVITIPLIPIFMIIIGLTTRDAANKRLATMQQLGRDLLDLLAGLSTLITLGRQHGPEKQIAAIGKNYTATTMSTLRIAFLSGAVLEFLATLSVAIVAVQVGFRLVGGYLDLYTGLIVIMLAPEIYLPLREVGKHYHAAADGVAAVNQCFEILETPLEVKGDLPAPDLSETVIEVENLGVAARGAMAPANLSFQIKPGTITALVGASGSGKTTTAMVLLKQLSPDQGKVTLRLIDSKKETHIDPDSSQSSWDLAEISPDEWFKQTTWMPQLATLFPGTILENLGLSPQEQAAFDNRPELQEHLQQVAETTGFNAVVENLEHSWQSRIGQTGVGLSVGQRQRLSLTRALLSHKQLIILDEPSAHLDARLEQQVSEVLLSLKAKGKTVILIAHRPALIKLADQVITVSSQRENSIDICQDMTSNMVEAKTAQAQGEK